MSPSLQELHQLRDRIKELKKERDEARRIAEVYRKVWERCSASVDEAPNPDPLPW